MDKEIYRAYAIPLFLTPSRATHTRFGWTRAVALYVRCTQPMTAEHSFRIFFSFPWRLEGPACLLEVISGVRVDCLPNKAAGLSRLPCLSGFQSSFLLLFQRRDFVSVSVSFLQAHSLTHSLTRSLAHSRRQAGWPPVSVVMDTTHADLVAVFRRARERRVPLERGLSALRSPPLPSALESARNNLFAKSTRAGPGARQGEKKWVKRGCLGQTYPYTNGNVLGHSRTSRDSRR